MAGGWSILRASNLEYTVKLRLVFRVKTAWFSQRPNTERRQLEANFGTTWTRYKVYLLNSWFLEAAALQQFSIDCTSFKNLDQPQHRT
jgi:hypothetical protein